jgi:quinol monooxygenase YgiN
MGQMVIVVYRPKPGREAELLELVRGHVPALRAEGMATERPPLVMRAADGCILEVFEWTSAQAVEGAHHSPNVMAMWSRFAEVCDYETLASLPEAQRLFSPFELVEL